MHLRFKNNFLYRYFAFLRQKKKQWNNKKKQKLMLKKRLRSNSLLDHLDDTLRKTWQKRCNDVLLSSDTYKIKKHRNAGKIISKKLIMHNGLKIDPLSYYDYPMLNLLIKCKGVHEPQEELVFQEVLKYISDGSTMIELGSYWGFYSMWFAKTVKNPKCYLVEPEKYALEFGKENFKTNHLKGTFINAFIGKETLTNDPIHTLCLDDIINRFFIKKCNIVHCDTQGAELDMLKGARNAIDTNIIDYFFISTHSSELHEKCRAFLLENKYIIIAEANMMQTYSVDGLIVGKNSNLAGPDFIEISLRNLN